MVLAAAAVVVAGYAVGTAVTGSGSSDDAGSAADAPAEAADGGDAGGGSSADESAPESEAESGAESGAGGGSREGAGPSASVRDTDGLLDGTVVRIRSDRVEADVSRALSTRTALRSRQGYPRQLSTPRALQCLPPALERGQRWLPARYDGDRAVLVTDPEDGGAVPAAVYGCDGALLASVVVGGD
jgi:hypothetical protein